MGVGDNNYVIHMYYQLYTKNSINLRSDDMETPNYVLRTYEAALLEDESSMQTFFRKVVLIIVGILIIGSFIFKDSLFSELNWIARILLIGLMIKFAFPRMRKIPSPIEIRFYNDYLIVYREKRYYSKKVTRMEYNKFYYKEISECEYKSNTQVIYICGTMEAIWYDYNKDGSLPSQPTYHRTVEDTVCYIDIRFSTDIDIIGAIEKHSTIRVIYK